jgi:putative ABC transport system permease protein
MNGSGSTRRILRRKLRRDLRRRRAQIIAVAGTIFLGMVLFTANLDASRNLGASYRETYERLATADVWIAGGPTEQLAAEIAATEMVAAVNTRTHADVPMRLDGRELVGRVIGGPDDGVVEVNQLLITDGRDLRPDDAWVTVLEQHAADNFNLGAGDTVEIWDDDRWRSLEIVGVAASAEYLFPAKSRSEVFTVPDEFAVAFVPESVAAEVAADGPRQIVARVDGRDPEVVADLLDRARAAGASEAYALADQPSNLALQADVAGFESLSYLFPILFLGAAGMATYVLLSRMIRQERTQIGMLVADGITSRTILRHYVGHALVVSLIGAIPGILIGELLGRWMTTLYTDFLGIPISVMRFSAATVISALTFALVVGFLSGWLPARTAARIDPAEAMRPPTPTGVDRTTWPERVWPLTLPMTARVVARNLARNPRRVTTTAVGVVLSMVVLITSLALNDTTGSVIDRQFTDVDRRDLSVRLDHPVTDADLRSLTALDEIATAEPSLELPVVISVGDNRSEQLLQVFRSDTVAHEFRDPLPASGIVLGSVARETLGVRVDDTVTVAVPALAVSVPVTVAGFVAEPIPSVSYTSLAAWTAAGGAAPTTVVLTLRDDSVHAEVRDLLAGRDDVIAVTDHRAMIDTIRELLGVTVFFVGLMVIFAILMTVGLLFNAVTVALAERTNEMATLQANGMPRRWIRTTVTAETVIVVLLGLAPGGLLGWFVAGRFMGQFDNESFRFDMVLSRSSLFLAVVLVLGVAVAAELPALRRVDRIDLPAVVRERSV